MNDQDKKRQLVARRLMRKAYYGTPAPGRDILEVTGAGTLCGAYAGLAKLLAPRTCTAYTADDLGFYGCSECGYDGWADEEAVTPYCPMCGAAVVLEGEKVR